MLFLNIYLIQLTHWGLKTPYGDIDLGQRHQDLCLTAPSHYLNQCWLIISEVKWHSYYRNFSRDAQPSITKICMKITYIKFHSNFPGANELAFNIMVSILSMCSSDLSELFGMVNVDLIFPKTCTRSVIHVLGHPLFVVLSLTGLGFFRKKCISSRTPGRNWKIAISSSFFWKKLEEFGRNWNIPKL